MFQPKKTKYSSYKKARAPKLLDVKYNFPIIGCCALKTLESGRITAQQLRAVRDSARKIFKRFGTCWVVVFPDQSVSKKPGESRMGKGKGGHDHWVALVRPGRILLEIGVYGLPYPKVKELLKKVQGKLSIKTTVVLKKY